MNGIISTIRKKGSYSLIIFTLSFFFFTNCSKKSDRYQTNLDSTQIKLEIKALSKLRKIVSRPDAMKYQVDSLTGRVTGVWLIDMGLEKVPIELRVFKKLKFFYLARNEINSIPKWIVELKNIEYFSIGSTKLKSLPLFLSELKKVNFLGISHLDMEEIPIELLQSWKELDFIEATDSELSKFPIVKESKFPIKLKLSSTKIDSIPDEVSQMRIKELWMIDNQLNYVSPHLAEVEELENLSLDGSPKLKAQIPDLSNCKNLQGLGLNWCGLTEFPQWITELPNLVTVGLGNNLITEIPEEIGNLKNLTGLHIEENRLETLPASLSKLKKLNFIDVEYNNITTLPEGMFDVEREEPCTIVIEGNPLSDIPVSEEQFRKGYKWYGID
ncbi:leucine-rich repeat domain-containing protein [Mangrovivirga cuniculi]|uniref:Disease resistance R13L4/SHOC-2-like LRR domain-containing protein n=1 Tax=Mangrovivirga cuniculi TaxID=2715131 RepID=A0A4D7KA71_9BACT|nr:hypothetical protein [Mangrovivirga cuniculi]QCK16248.1 hypothetical protein DCC35_16620 [Mangrovivirga cuniculi]